MTPETTPTSTDPAAETAVRTLLGALGIPASEGEITCYAADYPKVRAMADLLHAVPAARYEVPGLHFDPAPAFVDWA